MTTTDRATSGVRTILAPVTDVARAKAIYSALLGVPPMADSEHYVGFEAGSQHVGLLPGGGPQGMQAPVAYWQVDDIDGRLAEVVAAGATVTEPVRAVGGGRRVAAVADSDGNVLGLLEDREA